jgi:transposase InsO family protein
MFIKRYKTMYSIKKMTKLLGVSRSGYYAWERRKSRVDRWKNGELSELVRWIFFEHRKRYGSPRIWAELKERGWRISRKRVEKLMREQRLRVCRRPKWVKTTNSCHKLGVSGNILNRDFTASYPGEKWVSDITYLRTSTGNLYLTVVLDLWDRKVIGWSLSRELVAEQTSRAIIMAAKNRPPLDGLIFHSDQGVQYCSEEFRKTLTHICPSVRQSMSRKGNCWDNACAESFFKTLKTELEILNGRRKYSSSQVQTEVFEYIEVYYNRCRRHSGIGYAIPIALTPNEAA